MINEILRDFPIELLEKMSEYMSYEDTKHFSLAIVRYIPFIRRVEVFNTPTQSISDESIIRTLKDYPIAATTICMLSSDYNNVIRLRNRFPKLRVTTNALSYTNDQSSVSHNIISTINPYSAILLNSFKNIKYLELTSCCLSLMNNKITNLILNNSIVENFYLPNLMRLELTNVKSIENIKNLLESCNETLISLTILFDPPNLFDIGYYINKMTKLSYLKIKNVSIDEINNLPEIKLIIINGYCSIIQNCPKLNSINILPASTRNVNIHNYMPKIINCPNLNDLYIGYICIYSNLIDIYRQELLIFDPHASLDLLNEVRELTSHIKFRVINNYFNKNGGNYTIRSSNINRNGMPFVRGDAEKHYHYHGQKLYDVRNLNIPGIRNGVYLEGLNIDLIEMLNTCDRTYYS